MKFRKKPVVVEAKSITSHNRGLLARWCNGVVVDDSEGEGVLIKTPGGVLLAIVGDWIIRGIAGEFYSCKPAIFDETYEIVLSEEEKE